MACHRHPASLDDEHLLMEFRQGCQECFANLFWRYWRSVLQIALKIVRDRAEAEDVLQEVFLSVFLRPERYDESKGTVRTWLFQQCYYRSLMRRRHLSGRAHANGNGDGLADAESASCEQDPYLACLIGRGLESISPAQRRTLELVHFEGYTLREISALCNQTLAATRNYYYRGLKALRGILSGETGGKDAEAESIVPASDITHV